MGPAPASPEGDDLRRLLAADPATLAGEALMRVHAYLNPPEISGTGIVNTRRWRAAEVPSTNGHGNARAVARLYSALAGDGKLDGVHILAPETIATAIREQVYADDVVLQRPTRFGLGVGGSLGFADPDARVAFGYATNQGRAGWQHPHVRHLIDLVYAALYPGLFVNARITGRDGSSGRWVESSRAKTTARRRRYCDRAAGDRSG
jgi:CubicO group peptidase (beta-lactamase class C family)